MPITAQQCQDACDLLAEREELFPKVQAYRDAKECRIQLKRLYAGQDHNGKTVQHETWDPGPEITINASIRKLLLAGVEEELAAIDAQLLALGVLPPTGDEVAA